MYDAQAFTPSSRMQMNSAKMQVIITHLFYLHHFSDRLSVIFLKTIAPVVIY